MFLTSDEMISILKKRFEENMNRHMNLEWTDVMKRLEINTDKIHSLIAMEITEGEPDIIFKDDGDGAFIFYDCSAESPIGRRNTCYDKKGQEERNKKGVFPNGNAADIANAMGIDLLTEEQYKHLQSFGRFDLKSSSWLKTPSEIRRLGGAIFGDFRYGRVFIYHNSAPSFYSSRGFRGCIKI